MVLRKIYIVLNFNQRGAQGFTGWEKKGNYSLFNHMGGIDPTHAYLFNVKVRVSEGGKIGLLVFKVLQHSFVGFKKLVTLFNTV